MGRASFATNRFRRLAWRVGRRIYRQARGEIANAIATNGEIYVQSCVLNATRKSGDPLTVFDIGANVGEWTRSFLHLLSEDRTAGVSVIAFEPIPTTRARLEETIAAVDKGHFVEVLPIAVSDCAGEVRMAVFSATGGTNTIEFDAALGANAVEFVTVDRTTLFDFCSQREIDRVQLVKCDAEGHDAKVIAGGLGLLRARRVDVLQFEYNHRWSIPEPT